MNKANYALLALVCVLYGCNSTPGSSQRASEGATVVDCTYAEREIQALEDKLPDLARQPARSASSAPTPPWMSQDSRSLDELRRRASTLDQEQKIRRRIETLKAECDIP